MQRRHHYEQAFEAFLRDNRIPYVAVDEARKALLPKGATLGVHRSRFGEAEALKSFDFVVYARPESAAHPNLLVDIKGRKVVRSGRSGPTRSSLQNWVTQDDVSSLRTWESLFGGDFRAAFVFVYWCDEQPPDGLFQEVFEHRGRWYALRTVSLARYARAMRVRSRRWGTVHLGSGEFERLSEPFRAP